MTTKIEVGTILDCGHALPHVGGYGYDKDNRSICYVCCGVQDREYMIANGRITLYLTSNGPGAQFYVTNWPDSLRIPISGYPSQSWHNIAGKRYDVWFRGPDGFIWHGVQYGDNTQLLHCRRTKRTRF